MEIAFQVLLPAFDYDLAHSGKRRLQWLDLLYLLQHGREEHLAGSQRFSERQGLHRCRQLEKGGIHQTRKIPGSARPVRSQHLQR